MRSLECQAEGKAHGKHTLFYRSDPGRPLADRILDAHRRRIDPHCPGRCRDRVLVSVSDRSPVSITTESTLT